MSSIKKTPEDEAYDSLIQELGLDIDLDAPIGDASAEAGEELVEENDDLLFKIADRDAAPTPDDAGEDDGGVELSAELVAELRSVIMGGDVRPDEDMSEEGADVFASAEPAPLAEDPFTLETDLEPEEIEAPESLLEASVQEIAPALEDEADDADESVDELVDETQDEIEQEIEAIDSPDDEIELEDEVAFDTEEIEVEAIEDEALDAPPFADAAEFDAAEEGEPETLDEADIYDAEDAEDAEDDEGGFDLGFDAGVVLREVLEERRHEDRRPEFNIKDMIEDVDAPLVEETEEDEGLSLDDDMSLAEVLQRTFESAHEDVSPASVAAEDAFDDEDFDTEAPTSRREPGPDLSYNSIEEDFDDEFDALDRIDEAPLSQDFDPAPAYASAEEDDEPPPMARTEEDEEDVEYSFSYAGGEAGDRLVPRITLHAFCQTAPVTQLMMSMQNDRRMANVSMEVHQGGSPAAFDYYADRPTPHLMIVETTGSPARILAELDQLAERCDENVKVIVIGAANDIRLYRELMYRGVSEYIVPPMETVQLIRSVANLFVDPEQPFVGKSIAVTGVKGGVGSSTIAHNLAWAMSGKLEVNTTLVDLDLNFGTTGLDFNEESAQTIADAILSPDRFDEAVLERLLTKATDRLSLFTAPATLDRTYDLDLDTYEHVMGLVRQSVPFVVLDLPHIWADWFKSAVIGSDEIVVVAQPELASLRNGKNMIDFLKAARPNDAPPRLVINNVGVPRRPEIPVKDFAAAIGVEPELVLPFDPQLFGTAANNGQMILDVAPESKCAQGVNYLAGVLTGRDVPDERGGGSLLNKFFKR